MKKIEIYLPTHPQYQQVYDFANAVYKQTIFAEARTPPDVFITVVDNDNIYGCIGLNTDVTSSLFQNDTRFEKAVRKYAPSIHIGEQNIFAVQHFPAGIPLLFAAVGAYAHYINIQKIAFAGIPMSCKAVSQLGFNVQTIGETPLSVFTDEEQKKYRYWLEHFRPLSCILDTRNAPYICQKVMQRFSRKAELSSALQSCIAA